MAKSNRRYVCQECGVTQPRWSGQCDSCSAWNSVIEESVRPTLPGNSLKTNSTKGKLDLVPLSGPLDWAPRNTTGIEEFDRVLGGGLVPGSTVLIGGDPGIGKSTILLQVLAKLSNTLNCVYITGEEALDQVRTRGKRLKVDKSTTLIASATNISDILSCLDIPSGPTVAVIDSIQTMYIDSLAASPGTVSQVRAAAQELIRVAKNRGIAILLVGHVTKEGTIAGPRVLEHMVDTVLYFEGERGHQFRILRSVKNRYGATDEIGVFEMTQSGLAEVRNPSKLFLGDRLDNIVGTCVFGGMEGTRPLLVEIQALVAPSPFGTPRRAVIGWDTGRLAMVTAVLEARCNVSFSGKDVFLNVAGGLKVSEPGADLAVATAILSALYNFPSRSSCVIFGEIGLSAEVRSIGHMDARLKEASKLGFKHALIPKRKPDTKKLKVLPGMNIQEISNLYMLVNIFTESINTQDLALENP